MISFNETTEGICHIQKASKQKATIEQILDFLRTKYQYKNLPTADLKEKSTP